MKLLKALNKSLKKANIKMVLLVCLVIFLAFLIKKYTTNHEKFNLKDRVRFNIKNGKLVRDDNDGTHLLITTGEYNGTDHSEKNTLQNTAIDPRKFPKDHHYYYCNVGGLNNGLKGYVYASQYQALRQCGRGTKIQEEETYDVTINHTDKFSIINNKLVSDPNGKYSFANNPNDISEYSQLPKNSKGITTSFPIGHHFYYCDLGSIGFIYPTKYQAVRQCQSATQIQLRENKIINKRLISSLKQKETHAAAMEKQKENHAAAMEKQKENHAAAMKKQKENHAAAMEKQEENHAAAMEKEKQNAIKTTRDMYDTFFTYNKTIETGSKDDCMSKCSEEKYDDNTRKYDDAECETSCTTWNNKKQFSEAPYELIEEFTTEDVTHENCIEHCLNEDYPPKVCLRDCEKWAIQHNKKLENCFFRPGGLTPGDCKTRCEDYYNIVDPNDTICKSTCEDVCKKCDTADCKWTNFQSEEEFPYQLSIFGVASNGKVTLSWETPPYAVKKYIIMYFEEEQQHTKGVYFEEKPGSECNKNESYCSHIVAGLTNNKNYIMGVSVIFQSNDVTRMSNRLVMRPTRIITNEVEQSEKPKENKQESKAQTRTPAQILSAALLREKRKANSQKILTDFKKSQAEQISDLFSYLATNPINLQFKLS